MSNNLVVLTPKEVAELLKVTEEAIFAELETGRLKGFLIAGQWRTTEDAVMNMVSVSMDAISPEIVASSHTPILDRGEPRRKGIPTMEQIKSMRWDKIDEFDYQWPLSKIDMENGAGPEHYDVGYHLIVPVDGQNESFVIGFGTREAAGMPDRGRAIVFKGQPGRTLYPIVEFAGANDYDTSGKMVSIIRAQGRKPVRPGEAIPSDYDRHEVGIYNEIVVGPRAWRCRCVVANRADFAAMAHHAILRMHKIG